MTLDLADRSIAVRSGERTPLRISDRRICHKVGFRRPSCLSLRGRRRRLIPS